MKIYEESEDNIKKENTDISHQSNNTQGEDIKDANPSSEPEIDIFQENALEMATMTFKEKLQYKKNLRQQRMADMDTKEKISYIINYYKWHFIIGLFAIVCLAYTGRVIYRMTWPTVLELAIVNNTDDTKYKEYIPNAYRDYYDLNDKNYIEIYGDLSVSANEDTTEVGLTMSNYQTLGYYNMYNMLDVIICDKYALKLFVSTDDTTAIDLSMDDELYKQIEEYVITMSDPNGVKNDGKPYAVALDITDTEFAKNCHLSYHDVYLLIPSTKYEDNENTINFIKFVFGL